MTACQLSRMSWYISQMPSIRPTLGSHKNRFYLPNKRPSGTSHSTRRAIARTCVSELKAHAGAYRVEVHIALVD